ncbi:MAG: phospholipid carrier-dependent glycosyltransferase [Actinomycetota bacterium]|nr:phospholipid carrier-dependent glycosyltransferase [Actinomycetota bacterium]
MSYKEPPAAESLLKAARWAATPAGLVSLFSAGFLLRVLLARGGGFPADTAVFQGWAARLADVGPGGFYSADVFADYPPGFLYVLWPLGELAKVLFDGIVPVFLLKLTAIVADVALAYVVMRLASVVAAARGLDRWWVRPAAAAAILFNPPIVFLSAVWGQVDTVAALYVLAGILLVVKDTASARSEALGAALLALAFATKPQTAFLFPVVALVLVLRHAGRKPLDPATVALRLGLPALTFVVVWFGLALPFSLGPGELVSFYGEAGSTYPYTSVWAFNFWGAAAFWRPDSGPDAFALLGLPAAALGMIAFGAAACYVLIRAFGEVRARRPAAEVVLAGGAALVCLSFALLTRIHERYLFLAVACVAPLIVYRHARIALAALSALYMLNLYFPWVYYVEQAGRTTLKIGWLFDAVYGIAQDTVQKKLLSLVTAAVCVAVALRIWDLLKRVPARAASAPDVPAPRPQRWTFAFHPIGKKGAALAGLVFLVLVPTRLAGLGSPQGMYFDEIYHARTAGEYMVGKEAYEYTHPPLGKELMALSAAAFSGWRADAGGDPPAGFDGGIVDSDGTTAAWAAAAPGGGGALWTAPLGAACDVGEPSAQVPLEIEPERVAVAPTGGAFVAGRSEGSAVLARYSVAGRVWQTPLESPPVDMAAAGDSVFVVDGAGALLLFDTAGGETRVSEGATAVAPDAETGGVWASFAADRTVSAYDAAGTALASVQLYEGAEHLLVVPEADRVLALDTDTGLLEAVDTEQKVWLDRMATAAHTLAAAPVKGLAYAFEVRDVEVVEPRGLTVIGETTLPFDASALVPVRADGSVMAVGEDEVACVRGNNEFAWRLPGALAGALLPALVFLLALRCTGSLLAAGLAVVLMALDGLAFAMSRIATLDAQAAAHIAGAWLAAASVWFHAGRVAAGKKGASRRLGIVWLVATGVLLGVAVATKWVGVYSFGIIAFLMVIDLVARGDKGIGALFPSVEVAAVAIGGAVVVLPLAVYVASYVPYLSLDHSFGDLVRLQKAMFDYHAGLKEGHPYSSPWYGWPIGYRAVALYGNSSGTENAAIWAIANPVVLVGGLWGMVVAALQAWRRRLIALALLPLAALVQYVPWAAVDRAAFLYHYLPVVPFLAVALAWGLASRTRGSRLGRYEAGFVVVAAAIVFAVMLPELDGWYVAPTFHSSLQGWFPWLF